MPTLLRWPSLPYHKDDTGISTRNKSPCLSVTYSGYSEWVFGAWVRRRFPLWSVHPPKEKLARKPTSSSCPTDISDHVSSGTCRTSWSTKVEMLGPCQCERMCNAASSRCTQGQNFWVVYCRNCDRYGVTWKEALELRSQMVASSVVSRTSSSVMLSTVRMFRFSWVTSDVDIEPQSWLPRLICPCARLSEHFIFGLKGSAFGFDVPGLLAIVANARIIRFASVPRVGQSVRGTSTTVTWLVDRALHGAGFTRGLLRWLSSGIFGENGPGS